MDANSPVTLPAWGNESPVSIKWETGWPQPVLFFLEEKNLKPLLGIEHLIILPTARSIDQLCYSSSRTTPTTISYFSAKQNTHGPHDSSSIPISFIYYVDTKRIYKSK